MDKLIARERELAELDEAVHSKSSELILLKGRRRVGKTFLVRSYFQDTYTFHFVGRYRKKKAEQLEAFRQELVRCTGNEHIPEIATWKEAFCELQKYLERSSDERKIIFLDEIPWMDRYGNELIGELDDFWNTWVTNHDDIVLIACGSATSWMRKKFEKNRGGLHRRITHRLHIRPFYLSEVRDYLRYRGIDWSDYAIVQCYMLLGGIPYYLSLLKPQLSLPENIDELIFRRNGELEDEYDELFPALFNKSDKYVRIVRLLSSRREGFTRQEIEEKVGGGGGLTDILDNLVDCDFVSRYAQMGNKERGMLYRLSDMFLLFYFRYVDGNNTRDEQYWAHHYRDRDVSAWQGYSFEQVCLIHLPHIKQGLGISGMATECSTWRFVTPKDDERRGAQVDLVIRRADRLTHLVEMKFSELPYEITKDYEERLRDRRMTFSSVTGITHGLLDTFITPEGVKRNSHSSFVHSQLTAKDLFDVLK